MTEIIQYRPSGDPEKKGSLLGMPAQLYLQQFGDIILAAFGTHAYHVGSSARGGPWRDVDVRLMLDDEEYKAMGFGDPKRPQENSKWCAYCAAFSELGRRMTGLPIDFQIQDTSWANELYGGRDENAMRSHPRNALIMGEIRRKWPNT